jgi:hypothetical protein
MGNQFTEEDFFNFKEHSGQVVPKTFNICQSIGVLIGYTSISDL